MPEPELSLLFVRPLNELGVRYIPPEYVIVRKLEYFREGGSEKHIRDIRAILAVSSEELNRSELSRWVKRCGVESEWARAKAQETN